MHAVSADVQESGLLCEYGESLCENHGLYVKELCAQSRFWGCSARVLGEHKLNSIKAPDQVVWNSGQKWVICVRVGLGQRAYDPCFSSFSLSTLGFQNPGSVLTSNGVSVMCIS